MTAPAPLPPPFEKGKYPGGVDPHPRRCGRWRRWRGALAEISSSLYYCFDSMVFGLALIVYISTCRAVAIGLVAQAARHSQHGYTACPQLAGWLGTAHPRYDSPHGL